MIVAIFLILVGINFNIAAANPHGTMRSAKDNNRMALIFQWSAILFALIFGVYKVLT